MTIRGLANKIIGFSLTSLLICFPLIISAYPQASRSDSHALTREEKWRQDLRHFATELPRCHKNLFFRVTQKDFERAVTELDNLIPTLSDNEIIIAMMRIIAAIGDAHTSLEWQFRRYYPLGLQWFKDGLYLMGTSASYKQYLGMRLVRIGNTNIRQAYEAVKALIPHENEAWLLVQSPGYLVTPEILCALKILPEMDKGHFVFQDSKGGEFSVDPKPLTKDEMTDRVQAVDAIKLGAPLYRQKPGIYYWYEYLPDSKTLYVKYNRCANMKDFPFKQFNEQVWTFVAAHPVDRVIIDLRNNAGGDSSLFGPMLNELKQRPEINRRGRLFAVIGRDTYSSGILNAMELRKQTAAILIGGPTGQKPNFYGEVRSFKLPNSGLAVNYSTKYFKTMDGDPPSMLPDITVELTSADYLAASDPILKAILAFRD